jgi:hypothetical protein
LELRGREQLEDAENNSSKSRSVRRSEHIANIYGSASANKASAGKYKIKSPLEVLGANEMVLLKWGLKKWDEQV